MDRAEHRVVRHWLANGQFKGRCSCGARVSGSDRATAVARHEGEVEAEAEAA